MSIFAAIHSLPKHHYSSGHLTSALLLALRALRVKKLFDMYLRRCESQSKREEDVFADGKDVFAARKPSAGEQLLTQTEPLVQR